MSILIEPSAETCLLAIRWLLFLSMTIASLQNIANTLAYSARGLLAWPFLKYVYQYAFFEAPAFNTLFGRTGLLTLNLVRLTLLVAGAASYALPWVLTGLFVIQIALYLRGFLTVSAADQVTTIILIYLLVNAWLPSAGTLCLCGIAIQTLFCYFANGLIKTLEPRWTSGVHLKAILLTENYSRKFIAKKAKRTGLPVFRLLSRIVIIWELAALAAPFLPTTLLWVFLGFGILFHLAIALVLGLNTFFWSFISTYPAILFLNKKVDDLFR